VFSELQPILYKTLHHIRKHFASDPEQTSKNPPKSSHFSSLYVQNLASLVTETPLAQLTAFLRPVAGSEMITGNRW